MPKLSRTTWLLLGAITLLLIWRIAVIRSHLGQKVYHPPGESR